MPYRWCNSSTGEGQQWNSCDSAEWGTRKPPAAAMGRHACLQCFYDHPFPPAPPQGCYVGQELMARTHFKGVVRKRLMPFVAAPAGSPPVSDPQAAAAAAVAAAAASGSGSSSDSSSALQPGAAVYVEQEGGKRKSVGVVRVADGALGMAVLRLAAAQAAQAAGQPLLVGEGDSVQQLFPWRPEWWPRSWGHEEEDGAAGADS